MDAISRKEAEDLRRMEDRRHDMGVLYLLIKYLFNPTETELLVGFAILE